MESDFRKKSAHVPIAREGIPFILGAAFTTLTAAVLGCSLLAWPLLILTFLVAHFFRDPERVLSAGPLDVASPADGKIIDIERVDSSPFTDEPCQKISIFMSVFDVHVNRIPFSGELRGIDYRKGRFLDVRKDRASAENEQNSLWIQADSGVNIVLTQVAGLIARRIVCWPSVGDRVNRGERFGLIRFGSRVEVYVPEGSTLLVSKGDHVYGGETVLCKVN